jgi:type I restriction enzyme S subunit
MKFTGDFISSVIKRHFDVTLGKMLQPAAHSPDDILLPYVRSANVQAHSVDLGNLNEMWFSKSDIRNYTLSSGDLLVLEGGDVGRACIVKSLDGLVGFQNSVHRVRAKSAGSIDFARYWLIHLKTQGYLDLVCSKATLAHFTLEKFLESPFPHLPEQQQDTIARFLDLKTGMIDRLVEKKTLFIALLKEKRAAVITHAVTKGIDKDAPMKDSSVDWLGRIPAHWKVVPPTALFTESKERAREGDQMLSATQKYGVIPLAEYEALEQRQVTMAMVNLNMRKGGVIKSCWREGLKRAAA